MEQAFRTGKTAHLAVRPLSGRTEASTRGHAWVVMGADAIIRELHRAWGHLDRTVEEGIAHLATRCVMERRVQGHEPCCRIPKPRESSQRLLEAVGAHLPAALPQRPVRVVTKKHLPTRRKKRKNIDTYQRSGG